MAHFEIHIYKSFFYYKLANYIFGIYFFGRYLKTPTKKDYPQDFDACWNLSDVDPTLLDPVLLDFSQGRAAQKSKYLGELFPAHIFIGHNQPTFLEFFQTDKNTGRRKGIIAISLETLSL